MRPNFLVIGCARCGTTWLDKNLRHHPDIFLPRGLKEVHFFDRQYDRGFGWYEKFFREATAHTAVGEITPSYLYTPAIANLIKEYIPDVRLIVALRNPVNRAYSHYWNIMAKAQSGDKDYGLTFEQKLAQNPRLITDGLYGKMLTEYLTVFPKSRFLFLLYDDLLEDPHSYLSCVYNFLGVNDAFRAPAVRNRVNAASNKLGKSRMAYFASRALMKMGLYKAADRVEDANRRQLPAVSESTWCSLIDEHYRQDIRVLEKILERDLSHWMQYSNAYQ